MNVTVKFIANFVLYLFYSLKLVRFQQYVNVLNEAGIPTLVLESFCRLVRHCVTGSGGLYKLIFGKGTKLVIETSK